MAEDGANGSAPAGQLILAPATPDASPGQPAPAAQPPAARPAAAQPRQPQRQSRPAARPAAAAAEEAEPGLPAGLARGLARPQRSGSLSYSAPNEDASGTAQHSTGSAAGTSFANVGRNAPCPCGSGKKFKQCHGDPRNR